MKNKYSKLCNMSSVFKKIKSINQKGIEPIARGLTNYTLNIPSIEQKARQRLKKCMGCVNFVDEPISFLRIKDDRIKQLSNKMCDDCGCALPYLLRQDIKICKYWDD